MWLDIKKVIGANNAMKENKAVWNDVFKEKGRVFLEPHPDVVQLGEELQHVLRGTLKA